MRSLSWFVELGQALAVLSTPGSLTADHHGSGRCAASSSVRPVAAAVEGWHGVAAVGTAEQLAGCGVAAFEHGLEPGHGCFACQPEAAGAGAVPAAWDSEKRAV
jgi:hypothetical protein